ncbi:hypothetical protein F5878DRAFT_627567 [Lentinula raphanica]|uniref:Uncharacterized protein n=1 Tax=Lentinula raphanica TaxID=153919 RepID=A0AA38P3J5_9AGAR|nr:hypothetical protein F5878DRAFT_627567 [Lentinula raphanica]
MDLRILSFSKCFLYLAVGLPVQAYSKIQRGDAFSPQAQGLVVARLGNMTLDLGVMSLIQPVRRNIGAMCL